MSTSEARQAFNSSQRSGASLAESMALQDTIGKNLDSYTPQPGNNPAMDARLKRGIKILKLRKEIKAIEEEDAKAEGGARRSRKQSRSRKHKKTHRRR